MFTFDLLGGGDEKPKRGHWWTAKSAEGRVYPIICCPKCGQCSALSTHRIADDGEVSPSVVCDGRPGKPCSFHEYVTLDEVQPSVITGANLLPLPAPKEPTT